VPEASTSPGPTTERRDAAELGDGRIHPGARGEITKPYGTYP
jgi:hypothetical protein